jgi:type IX secretion system PorP/SprF family membrane protein
MKTKTLLMLILIFAALETLAQVDPHFSQYYIYPQYLNPALTGVSDADYRATAIYRNQWTSFGKFTNKGISADAVTERNLNFGFNVLNQKAGDGGYGLTNGYLSIAYTGIRFDDDGHKRVILGLQGGFINRKFDLDKLQFGNQWRPYAGYSSALNSGEIWDRVTSTVFDANAGVIYYDANPDKQVNIFAGASVGHLTQPEDPFLFGAKQKLPMRYTLHGGARINLSGSVSFAPNFIYMAQGNATEKMLGGYFEIGTDKAVQVLAGANIRIGDAIVPFAGISFEQMMIGLNYDINTSKLSNTAGRSDSFEISLTFTKKNPDMNYLKCPRF